MEGRKMWRESSVLLASLLKPTGSDGDWLPTSDDRSLSARTMRAWGRAKGCEAVLFAPLRSDETMAATGPIALDVLARRGTDAADVPGSSVSCCERAPCGLASSSDPIASTATVSEARNAGDMGGT